MLLAVEGGGFISSSASGYSKGLTLLFLGHKKEKKPMRVAPWTHYQLVDQETDPSDLQLDSGKNSRGCASFVCFGRAAGGPEGPSPPKGAPTQNQEVLPGVPLDFDDESNDPVDENDSDSGSDDDDDDDDDDGGGDRQKDISRKSSLKKLVNIEPGEMDNDVTCKIEKRNVQWTDAFGGELFEIREFETSEGSDDGFDHANGNTCACVIM